MDQRHTRGVAGNMPLDFGYQFLSSQSKSNRCRSAGDGIGVLRDLGSAPPNEQSDLRTRLSAFQANNVRAAVFLRDLGSGSDYVGEGPVPHFFPRTPPLLL